MLILNMVLHLILFSKPLVTFISAPCSRAVELPRPSTMFCCMALEIGKTAKGLLTDRADLSRTRSRGWRLGGSRVNRRDVRGGCEEAGVRTSDYTVGDLGRSGEDGAIGIVPRRNGIRAIVVGIFAHS